MTRGGRLVSIESRIVPTDRGGETIVIDAKMVQERVAELAKDADLSKFIL